MEIIVEGNGMCLSAPSVRVCVCVYVCVCVCARARMHARTRECVFAASQKYSSRFVS